MTSNAMSEALRLGFAKRNRLHPVLWNHPPEQLLPIFRLWFHYYGRESLACPTGTEGGCPDVKEAIYGNVFLSVKVADGFKEWAKNEAGDEGMSYWTAFEYESVVLFHSAMAALIAQGTAPITTSELNAQMVLGLSEGMVVTETLMFDSMNRRIFPFNVLNYDGNQFNIVANITTSESGVVSVNWRSQILW